MKVITNFTNKTAREFPGARDLFAVWADICKNGRLEFQKEFSHKHLVKRYEMRIVDPFGKTKMPWLRQYVAPGELGQRFNSTWNDGGANSESMRYEFREGRLSNITFITGNAPGVKTLTARFEISRKNMPAAAKLTEALYAAPMTQYDDLFGNGIKHVVKHHIAAVDIISLRASFIDIDNDKREFWREFFVDRLNTLNKNNIDNASLEYESGFVKPDPVPALGNIKTTRTKCSYNSTFPLLNSIVGAAKTEDEAFRAIVFGYIDRYMTRERQRNQYS